MKHFYEAGEDTWLMKKWVRKLAHGRVLEVGCGSGELCKTAESTGASVVGVDVNPLAVEHAKKLCDKAKIVVSDLFENVKGEFDLIVFNPPYLPEDDREPVGWGKVATTFNPQVFERFLVNAKKHLKKSGKILLLLSSLTPSTAFTMVKNHFKSRVLDEKKLSWEKLFVLELS